MSRLKNEISWLRKKSALKANQELDGRSCGRCQTPFGLLVNRGAACPSCRQRVCKQCREDTLPGREWVCIVCRKQIEIQLATGEWINDIRTPFKCMKEDSSTLPRRQKVRRSWTISNPSSNKKEGDLNRTLSSSVPAKPHRRRSQQDENIPPERSRERPKRRFSMSSIDSLPRRVKSPNRRPQEWSNRGSHSHITRSAEHSGDHSRGSKKPNISQQQGNWYQQKKEFHLSNRDVTHHPYRDSHSNRDAHQLQRNPHQPSRDVHQPYRDAYHQNLDTHRSRELRQKNRDVSPMNRWYMQREAEKPEKFYFFGDARESLYSNDRQRSSTLPRQPRPGSRSNQIKNNEAEVRFHSMPRTRSREAKPHEVRPDLHAHELRSSDGSRFPNRFSNQIRDEATHSDSTMMHPDALRHQQSHMIHPDHPPKPVRDYVAGDNLKHSEVTKEWKYPKHWPNILPRHAIDFNDMEKEYTKERVHKIYMEGDLELDKRMGLSSQHGGLSDVDQLPADNYKGRQNSKHMPTEEIHHITEGNRTSPYSKISRSNTSVIPGFGTACKIGKPSSQLKSMVKRSQSLQRNGNNDFKFQPPNEPKGAVAKFVQDIEMGIKLNYNNVDLKQSDSGGIFSPDCYAMKADPVSHFANGSNNEKDEYNERNEQMDVYSAIDSSKILPDGDDYKLVFISSDSSKDSEQNTSIDSDITSIYDTVNMDADYIQPIYENSRKFADVSVMADMDASSVDETSLLDVSMASSLCYPSDSHYDCNSVGTLTPMTAMDADELGLIMQQTEVVQAEAQALQQALMSAFELQPIVYRHNNEQDSSVINEIINSKQYGKQLSKYTNRINDGNNTKHDYNFSKIDLERNQNNNFVPQFTLKEKRNVATQANLSNASSDSDASGQDSYYESSMLDSEDDIPQTRCLKDILPAGVQINSLHFTKSDLNMDKNCLKQEGQTTLTYPTYLSGCPPSLPQISLPDNHLQLTLNRNDSVSILPSVSEGCAVPLLEGLNTNVNSSVHVNSETNGDTNVSNVSNEASCKLLKSSDKNSLLKTNLSRIDKKDNAYKILSFKPTKIPLNNLTIFPKLSEIRMNSEINKEHGDINAGGKVISDPPQAQVHAPLKADEASPSSTSDEDTDEEKHVSRSYNVSSSTANDSCKSSGTSSDSDAQSLHCAYLGDNTKTNNDSPDKQDVGNGHINDERNAALVGEIDDSEDYNSDSEMKLYLPECDQNIADNSTGAYNSESTNAIDKSDDAVSDVDNDPYDTSESVVENKSETESNIGVDVESIENKDVELVKNIPFVADTIRKDLECENISCEKNVESVPSGRSGLSVKNDVQMQSNTLDIIAGQISKDIAILEENTTIKNKNFNSNSDIISENCISMQNLIEPSQLEDSHLHILCKNENNKLDVNDKPLVPNENVSQSILIRELVATKITGSKELEHNSCEIEPVAVGISSELGEGDACIDEEKDLTTYNEELIDKSSVKNITDSQPKYVKENDIIKVDKTSIKDHSRKGESTKQISGNKHDGNYCNEIITDKSADMRVSADQLICLPKISHNIINSNKIKSDRNPVPPLRKAKRSSSSDGLSSSSDIERSDIDASDSADTIVEILPKNILEKKKPLQRNKKQKLENQKTFPHCSTETHFSDNNEEGNLVSIVAVGEYTSPKPQSQGKIYIRPNSTDSDVQINPSCIVLTGDTSPHSESDADSDHFTQSIDNFDITVLDCNDKHGKNHVMSFKVTSPESSRCPSPTKGKVDELQFTMRSAQDSKQQYRSPIGQRSDSSLTNYFTVTLGSDSPALPRRVNKTPEVRRRKTSADGNENVDYSSTPSQGHTPTHTPSPTLSHSPNDFEDRDEYSGDNVSRHEIEQQGEINYDDYYAEDSDLIEVYGEQYASNRKENDVQFDSIEEFESIEESNYSETSSEDSYDREEEIKYAKRSYNFALHTIIEESCEDSDYDKKVEEKTKHDQSELEKYFYFGLGNGLDEPKKYANEESEYSDTFSETSSSVYSEGVESMDNEGIDPAELASSRLEKYFKDFINFERQPSIRSVGEESENRTDESDSVGSDSEGSPSPEQPRKKLFRSRGVRSVSASRSHGYCSDKGEGMASDSSHHSGEQDETSDKMLVSGEEEGSTESEENAFEKSDGQFDTIKRRKKKKGICEGADKKHDLEKSEIKSAIIKSDENAMKRGEYITKESSIKKSLDYGSSQISNEKYTAKDSNVKQKDESFSGSDLAVRKYQSRDSGFIGSSDDLLKDKPDESLIDASNKEFQCSDSSNEEKFDIKIEKKLTHETKMNKSILENTLKSENEEKSGNEGKVSRSSTGSSADLPNYGKDKGPQTTSLNRKDSFNNWSSDEETNIMMNKMRLFFKNMFSHTHSNNGNKEINKGLKIKSPQLMMFETKLTNLMRTVPGINDEQVKEIVEYLSSEDTWSDSYDSSDYTSSDLEGAYARLEQAVPELQSELQKQISVECQQIIENFDQGGHQTDIENAKKVFAARSFIENNGDPSNKDTFFMYHKIMSSITHARTDSDRGSVGSGSQSTSPPLLAKVMHYLGNRLVALMHEVSVSSENGEDADSFTGDHVATSTPRQKLFLPKKYKHHDSVSLDSSVDKHSLNSTSFESEDSPTDTENSPESEIGTPKAGRHNRLTAISEKSSTEDFVLAEYPKHASSSSETIRYSQFKKSPGYVLHRIQDERGAASNYISDYRSKDFETWRRSAVDDRIDVREHGGVSKALSRSGRRADARKARSHMSLEKIHQEDVKNTGERSESLGDLLDRVKSSGFSSSYEQLDSDSTLRASDSLDRQIGSSSSNVRLNASSRGSLNTSSRGSLAASSRGSLNASSRGSLPGSSGPDEDEDKKTKKSSSFFRYARRSNILDESKEPFSREIRSTTLPRSTPAQILATGTLPRSNNPPSHLFTSKYHPVAHVTERNPPSTSTGPRSARYHPPGYRPPSNSNLLPKRTISTPILKKDKTTWHTEDEVRSNKKDAPSASMSVGSLPKASLPNAATGSLRGGLGSSNSSRTASPLGGSLGRASAASLASFDNLDEEAKRFATGEYRRNNSLSTLGLKSRSDSLASVCSNGGEGRYGAVSVMGEVQFGLQYNYKEGQLECHVIGCRDLAPVDTRRNRSDPYVKAYLLPDKSKNGKKKTKVKRHTLSPMFEETLKFQTTLSDLESRTLWLSVWHYGVFGRNDFLGEVLLRLHDSVLEESSMKWYPLQDRTEVMEEGNYGAILVIALKFIPPDALAISGIKTSSGKRRSRGALQVRIKEASGLVNIKAPQTPPDPICKGILLPDKGKSSKQKTSVCRKTSNPHWNHTMTFDDVTLQELTDRSLEISILDHDRFGASEFMGGCRFNLGNHISKEDWMDASGLEQKLWEQMLERPNLWVESSLLLRGTIDRPIYSLNFTE